MKKPHLQSSIFGPASRIALSFFDLRLRRILRRSDGREGYTTSSKMKGPSKIELFDLPAPKNGEPPSPVESKTRTYYVRAGRSGAVHGGSGAGRGGAETGHRRIDSPRKHPSFFTSRASRTTVLNVPAQARTNEIPCKPIPIEKQNSRFDPRFIRDLSAV